MFAPFENPNQFFPGLILWCDPNSYDMEVTTMPPNTTFDRKKVRELRPCLVVAVNQTVQMLQVARLCATTPTDTRRWIRIDSAPPITWKLPDAWIWVGTPATVKMILNNHKAMHPHKDVNYTTPPVSATNLQNYWAHRQNYLTRVSGANSYPSNPGGTGTYNQSNTYYPASGSSIYSTAPNTPVQSTSNPSNLMFANNDINNPDSYPAKFNPAYLTSGYYSEGHPLNMNMNMNAVPQQQAFNTLAPQPVVVPAGFTETHASAPGWWRNPQTGWFWHAARGLLPPAAMTGGGPA